MKRAREDVEEEQSEHLPSQKKNKQSEEAYSETKLFSLLEDENSLIAGLQKKKSIGY